MTYEQIEKITQDTQIAGTLFEISFRVRNPVKGLFIKTIDYRELSKKNLWRIVSETNVEEYNRTRNENLTRIFNGVDFTRLKAVTNK